MPDQIFHEEKVKEISEFYGFVNSTHYKEWIVVTRFYEALHKVDAYLAQNNHRKISSHTERLKLLQGLNPSLFAAFNTLYGESRKARYTEKRSYFDDVKLTLINMSYKNSFLI